MKILKTYEQVALKLDTKYRGIIDGVQEPYGNEPLMYHVKWDNMGGVFMYPGEMIISKEEADKIENEKISK